MRVVTGIRMRWMIRLLLLLLVAVPAINAKVVWAQPYTFAGEWEITFEIVNSKIRATWVGRVWDYNDGNEMIIAQRRVDISNDCQSFGGPSFGEAAVSFDGVNDYITCKIPEFQSIFATMYPPLANCRCRFDGPPYAAADISPVYSNSAQPVVYHNRLRLDVMHIDTNSARFPFIKTGASGVGRGVARDAVRVDANNSLGIAQLTLHFNDKVESWESNLFSIWQQNGFQIWAGYDAARYTANNSPDGFAKFLADSGFWDEVQPEYADGFFIWESEAQSKYTGDTMESELGIDPGTFIYIGHNPETDTYFNGTIRAVSVDPGCRGH